jgi:hypothetical protein
MRKLPPLVFCPNPSLSNVLGVSRFWPSKPIRNKSFVLGIGASIPNLLKWLYHRSQQRERAAIESEHEKRSIIEGGQEE